MDPTAGLLPKQGDRQLSSPLALSAQTAPPSLPSLPGGSFCKGQGMAAVPPHPSHTESELPLAQSFGTSALGVWGVLLKS